MREILLLFFFFVSGACGLIYEVVWSREFTLVVGGTTRAITAVVAAFMAGLGAGSWWGGRLVDRSRRHPVLIYAVLEAGIGLWALAVPLWVRLAHPALAFFAQHFEDLPRLLDLCRFGVSALILFPPTFLMGATLPVLVKATLSSKERFGFTAGRLYALNTAGAMSGVALAGFVLLRWVGSRTTVFLAAGMNLLIAVLITALFRHQLFSSPAAVPSWRERDSRRPVFSSVFLLLLIGYALSGAAALIYQIAWTRSLTLTLGGSTYSFSLILSAYIAGLALGSALLTPWADRFRRPLFWAAVMEVGIIISAVAVLPLLDHIILAMFDWVARYQEAGRILSWIRLGVTFGLMVIPTMLMGALLPLVARVAGREHPGAGEPMGWVYGVNTAGAIAGAFLSGYFLLDLLGVRGTVFVAAALSAGAAALWLASSEIPRRVAVPAAVVLLLGAASGFRFVPPPDPLILNSGPYLYAPGVISMAGEDSVRQYLHRQYQLLYFREDAETTVSVLEDRVEQWRVLRINGKVDASTMGDVPNQILLAQLPLLFHPHPRTVMVLGLASGMTAGSALLHPIESLDCLELSPAVVEASRLFEEASKLRFDDPRFHLILNDGRNHLALSGRRYDVIISEPSNPWQAAMSSMFTAEFFTLMRSHLNPGGMAVAWIDVYNMNLDSFRLILRTFAHVFPYASLWESDLGGDYILIGSNVALQIDPSLLIERCQRPEIATELLRFQDDGAVGILARFMMDQNGMRAAAGEGPIHTDDRRQLEFEMPRQAFVPYSRRIPEIYDFFLRWQQDVSVLLLPGKEELIPPSRLRELNQLRAQFLSFEAQAFRESISPEEYLKQSEALLERLGSFYPNRVVALNISQEMARQAMLRNMQRDYPGAAQLWQRVYELDPASCQAASSLAKVKFLQHEHEAAREWAERALARCPQDRFALVVLASVAGVEGKVTEEERYLRQALEVYAEDFKTRLLLGRNLLRQRRWDEAAVLLEVLVQEKPDNADAHFFLGSVYFRTNDFSRSRFHLLRALELDPRHPSRTPMEKMLLEMRKISSD